MLLDEIKYRDKIIRNYILGRSWDDNDEFLLVKKIVSCHAYSKEYQGKLKVTGESWKTIITNEIHKNQCDWENILSMLPEIKDFPYLFNYEWEVNEIFDGEKKIVGKGDLVFANGKDNYLIVELKYQDLWDSGKTARTRRTAKRKEIQEQTVRYMELFRKLHAESKTILGLSITNNEIRRFR